MDTNGSGFSIPTTPDWQGFLKCLKREGTPERVHFIELIIDGEVQEEICQRYGLLEGMDPSDPFFSYKRQIAVQSFLGYDYVIAPGSLGESIDGGLMHHSIVTEDTAGKLGRLGVGDYRAIEKPVGGISEIQLLQAELIQMAGKLKEAQESLHRYIGVITSSQEDERRRLARELHDDTIQSLIAFKQRVQLAEMDWEDQPVAQSLKELEDFAEDTIANLRRMIRALRPIYLEDLGLVAAINMLVDETGKQAGINVDFEQQGIERRLAPQMELALYRIVQEALNNVTRHASATHAAVKVKFLPEGVNIDIKDNGKGFPTPESPNELASGGHFGLLGMYERADLIGGKIRLESKPGHGTHLSVFVPGS